MTNWIENISRDDLRKGNHTDMGPNAMLIQIADPSKGFPTPKYQFKEVHQFEFFDLEDRHEYVSEFRCTPEQGAELARLLKHALENNMNVLVQCHVGICRSGAVVAVGELLGFTSTGRWKAPNLLVKRLMLNALGMNYND